MAEADEAAAAAEAAPETSAPPAPAAIEGVQEMPDGKIRVQLSDPITAHGETTKELSLARPRMKHLKAQDGAGGDVDASLRVIAKLAGIPPSSAEELSLRDYNRIERALAPFVSGLKA